MLSYINVCFILCVFVLVVLLTMVVPEFANWGLGVIAIKLSDNYYYILMYL